MTVAAATDEKRPGRFPAVSLLICLGCLAAALALVYPPIREKLDRIEYWTADWRTALLADRVPEKHERVIVVVFDPATFDGGVISPIPRDTHAQVLRTLDAMRPAAIGLDFYFVASQGPDKDGAMLETLHKVTTPIVLGAIDQHTTEFTEKQQAYQQRFLAEAGRPAGYLGLRYDPGHIVRRTSPPLPESAFQESFARQVAIASGAQLKGPGASSASMRVAWVLGAGHDVQPFLTISAKELLPGADAARLKELEQRIKGNVVLTGIDMPNSDRHDTALSVWTDEKMLGALIHAHIIAQLLDGRYFFELEGAQKAALLVAVGLLGLGLGWAVRGRPAALLNLTVATAILVGVDAVCYYVFRIVLPFTLSLYVWFIGVMAGQHLRTLAQWAGARGEPAAA
jgi:CHASE2 domain-containing sensor protein